MTRTVYQYVEPVVAGVSSEETNKKPYFTSLTGALVHTGVEATSFTKDGISAKPFPNPTQDPVDYSQEETLPPLEKSTFFVEFTADGELHIPPLTAQEAREHYAKIATQQDREFNYEAENLIPAI